MTDSIFQRLYDSEINFEVSSFWDGGLDVRLGDAINGFVRQEKLDTWSEVEGWLQAAALRHYPNSDFARQELGDRWKPVEEPRDKSHPRNGP